MQSFENIDELCNTCLQKWQGEYGIDSRLQEASAKFEHWAQQIPCEYKTLAYTLILNLEYYSRRKANHHLSELHKILLSYDGITVDNTIYTFIKDKDGQTNSSNDYWTEYKCINNLNLSICYEDITKIPCYAWNYIDNVVFIDDFSGSGDSIIDELEKHQYFQRQTIYFMTITIMEQAVDSLKVFAEKKGINIIPIYIEKQDKVFSRNFFEDNTTEKEHLKQFSKDLKIPKKHCLGYNDSESLVAFYNNTPNNTLGLIRYKTENYQPLFPRRNDKKPPWQKMSDDKRNRHKSNYNNSISEKWCGNI